MFIKYFARVKSSNRDIIPRNSSSKQWNRNKLFLRFLLQDRPIPSHATVINTYEKFKRVGCLHKCRSCMHAEGWKPKISEKREEIETAVCAAAEVSEPCSSRKIAEMVPIADLTPRTTRNILHRNGYHSFKVGTVQEIFPLDKYRRMEFCETVMEKANRDGSFIGNILFTDESTFPLHGHHNPSVVRYWSRENKHLSIPVRTQYPQKLNVWAGILGNNIIGPFFIDGTLTAAKYLALLQTQIVPAIRQLGIDLANIWFQQDGCPAHNAAIVHTYLESVFDHRIIGGNGTIKWPPRSPDLAPNDFFLWGYVKSTVYTFNERADNLHNLQVKIVEALGQIQPSTLLRVRQEFYNRLTYCSLNEGDVFEPQL
ncbi:unnamed protein product [Acanthoscelides obtectus]|uniref:Transposase n=1 Tax=Acanthoscelides obtectus TaxID=200917 RepID=A0A9P0M6T4_ACAOB|nr:unnamed protein product [Acanthoscelides obtectus]CAK1644583.1 Transposable element Tc3 transposase [Acanthoscelides obtectus]